MEKLPNGAVCIKFMDTVFVIIRVPINKQITISHFGRLLGEHDK